MRRLLLDDLDACGPIAGIVRVDHRADAVLQLRNHLAAAIVRGRIGGEEDQHVDVEPHRIAADLHVALLKNVEQADLDQLVEFGQLVHRKDPPVHAGNQSEVQRLLGRHGRAAGQPSGIDLADHVGKLRAGGKSLGVPPFARPPGDRHLRLGQLRHHLAAGTGNGPIRVLVHRTAWNVQVGQLRIEESSDQPHQPALGLPLLAQEEQVVPGDQPEVDLRDDRVFVADDAGKEVLAMRQGLHEVIVNFPLDRLGNPTTFAEFQQVGRSGDGRRGHCVAPPNREVLEVLNQLPS